MGEASRHRGGTGDPCTRARRTNSRPARSGPKHPAFSGAPTLGLAPSWRGGASRRVAGAHGDADLRPAPRAGCASNSCSSASGNNCCYRARPPSCAPTAGPLSPLCLSLGPRLSGLRARASVNHGYCAIQVPAAVRRHPLACTHPCAARAARRASAAPAILGLPSGTFPGPAHPHTDHDRCLRVPPASATCPPQPAAIPAIRVRILRAGPD
jgi:hypothetical protein